MNIGLLKTQDQSNLLQEDVIRVQRQVKDVQQEALTFDSEKFKAERRPEVFVTFEPYTMNSVSPNLMNFGHTPAVDVSFTYNGQPTDGKKTELGGGTISSLMPGEKRILFQQSIPIHNLKRYERLEIDIDLKDVTGYPAHQATQVIAVGWLLYYLESTGRAKDEG